MLVTNKIKVGDIISIKFENGEEIIAEYLGEEGNNMTLGHPQLINEVINKNKKGYAYELTSFMLTVLPESNIIINKNSINVIMHTNEEMIRQFKIAISLKE